MPIGGGGAERYQKTIGGAATDAKIAFQPKEWNKGGSIYEVIEELAGSEAVKHGVYAAIATCTPFIRLGGSPPSDAVFHEPVATVHE